ncbi:MAG: hypothetical protein GOP50_10255 [Candidatus Heimdallarchaeota archaeon]|nr:hypothetical protein [Candidatus Heimdallarchaeota archaeon]
MGKGTAIFLSILFVVLAGGAIIGVDVYLSYKGYTDNPDSFDVTDIAYVVASNNESAVVSAVVVTPKLGYMPKSVRLDIEVYKNGNTTLYDSQKVTIPLGANETIEFTVIFEDDDIVTIAGGGTITFSVEVLATPIYIGIPLNFIAMEIPPIVVAIP